MIKFSLFNDNDWPQMEHYDALIATIQGKYFKFPLHIPLLSYILLICFVLRIKIVC